MIDRLPCHLCSHCCSLILIRHPIFLHREFHRARTAPHRIPLDPVSTPANASNICVFEHDAPLAPDLALRSAIPDSLN